MRIRVLTAAKSSGISEGLTYESDRKLSPGSYVSVPLRNKAVDGIVLEDGESGGDFDVKSIVKVLSEQPLLSKAHIKTLLWMSDHYCCSVRQAIRVFLPSPPWSKLLPAKVLGYTLLRDAEVRGKKQQAIVEALKGRGFVAWETLRAESGATKVNVRSLIGQGIVAEEERLESVSGNPLPHVQKPKLSEIQKLAVNSLCKSNITNLLFGVTGSGKTEVYAELVAGAANDGKQSIILVPEILLTEQIIRRFTLLLGAEHIEVLHSRLTQSERMNAWRRIRYGDVKLVIGSRSALFAPVTNLGLIVIDEEHEWTYKNEQTPRYHARETAEKLCEEFGAKLVLGSATPSVESWKRAKDGSINLVRLDERYNNATLPLVKVIDLANVNFGNEYPFSKTLLEAIEERLKKNEQSVLFLNRRGAATSLLCLDCRRRVVSPDSNLPFTVHKDAQNGLFLQDHTTGATASFPEICPGCQSTRLRAVGAGTQRIEDILKRTFPKARILRADSDNMTTPEDMRTLLDTMLDGRGDILLGTQTVVKGLDLPNVTLAAVLIADVGMSLPHFRAGERVFQLLTQLVGRSGRAAKSGEVIIQTFRPDAPEVKYAALHKTEEYLDLELKMRLATGYPPASDMVRLILRGPDAKVRATALSVELLAKSSNLAIGCAPTLFGGGKEWHILIRGKDPKHILREGRLEDVVTDVDPVDCV